MFPEFAPPRVEIQTIAIGNSSTEVEELITAPMEEQLAGIEGVDELRSKSVGDLSSIQLIFDRGYDQQQARQLVAERVAQLTPSLPTWAAPPVMMPPLSSTSRVMKIGLTSDTVSLIDMSRIAYWNIRQRLLRVTGVANVAIWGERLQQEHVQVDPRKLAAKRVSLERVMDTTAEALDAQVLRYTDGAVIGTGGFVENAGRRLNVRTVQPIESAQDLAKVPLARRDGKTLRLGDVGDVLTTTMPTWGDAVINDGPGLMLVVQKFPDTNTLEVTEGIEDAMEELRPALAGIDVDTTIFRPATFIETAIDNLTTALVLGILLVVLILIAFLMEWRTAFISLVSIPLSLMAALLVLDLRDATINVMILAGLVVAIGVVVDDAIIDVENIVRRLRQHRAARATGRPFRVILDASVEVRSAITYATLINVVAIVPVFFLGGLSGAFFAPLALSYGLAVLASMLVALTVTPALCLILLRRAPLDRGDSWLAARGCKRGYAAVLAVLLRMPRPAMAAVVACLLAGRRRADPRGVAAAEFKERDFLMHWLTKPGTSSPRRRGSRSGAARTCARSPASATAARTSARRCSPTRCTGSTSARTGSASPTTSTTTRRWTPMQRTVETYPGMLPDVQTYLRERIKEVLTGTSEAIVVRISGPTWRCWREGRRDREEDRRRRRRGRRPRVAAGGRARTSRSRSTSGRGGPG